MRNELEKRLRKKRLEVEDKDNKIRRLEAERAVCLAVIAELEGLLRYLPKSPTEGGAERHLRVGSDVYKARETLILAREPLHIKDLLEKIGGDTGRNRRSSLSAQLSQYARKSEVFTKVAPNTFGLIDFGPEPDGVDRQNGLENQDLEEPNIPTSPSWDDDIPF
jgi:hypothetical protein